MTFNNNGTAITLLTTHPPDWMLSILEHLTIEGYQLTIAKKYLITESHPAAIITGHIEDQHYCSNILQNNPQMIERPLHIFITDTLPPNFSDNYVDIVLPPTTLYVMKQIRMLLALRQENLNLYHQVKNLEQQNTTLTQQLEKQKRLNSEIEVLKNAIVRNVSHELKTPLLHVKSAVSLIAEDVDNEELVAYAKGATSRLEALVKNITWLGNSLDVNPGPVIVRDTIEYARRNLRRTWQHQDDTERIKFDIPANLPPVFADKQGLSTVFQLLIENALKFSQKDVTLQAQKTKQGIQFTIQDHGIGIEQKNLDVIFETFFQVDSSSTRQYGGTGVGLAIVKLILDNHNTAIYVDSEVGRGTTFTFTLPQVQL